MKHLKFIVSGIAVVLVSAAFFWPRGGGELRDDAVLTAEVQEGPLLITVHASGEIRSKTSSKIIPGIKRPENVAWLIAEGTRVTNGQLIGQFSTEEMGRKILDAEFKVSDAETKLLSARTDYEVQQLDNAAAITAAMQAVQSAELTLRKVTEGDSPTQLKTAELKARTAAIEHERSVKKFAESEQILKQGFITADQLEEERIALEKARVDKEITVDDLNTLKLYTIPLKEADARAAKIKADTDLEKTKKKNDVKIQTAFMAMETARIVLGKSTNDLHELRTVLQNYDVKSPSEGIVTYGDPDASWRRSEVQVGMTLQPGEVLMTIPDMGSLQAVVDVPEADIPKVKVGQQASVNIEAIAHRTFKGRVDRVAEIANPGGFLEAAVKQFKVNVVLDNTTDLRPGFSADVEILIETLPSVVHVPVQAVHNEGGDFIAWVDSALGPVRTPVSVGKSSITHVEILGGLKKGQRVLLSKPANGGPKGAEKSS